MRGREPLRLEKEKREEMTAALRAYFLEERGEEIGHLASSLLLDLIIEKLAPEFYNQGVMDAHRFLSDKVEDVQLLLR